MKKGSDQETLLMQKQLVDDVNRTSDSYNKLDTRPIQSATMEFIPVEEYKNSMPQFGHLSHGEVFPTNSEALYVPEMVSKGERIKFNVFTKDRIKATIFIKRAVVNLLFMHSQVQEMSFQ